MAAESMIEREPINGYAHFILSEKPDFLELIVSRADSNEIEQRVLKLYLKQNL